MANTNKAFREYATRISFNISLSRNQIYTLWNISLQKLYRPREEMAEFGLNIDMFVPGAKWLCQHGLVTWVDPITMKPPWKEYPYKLTEAGTHLLALLRIAEVIPKEAVNTNEKPKLHKLKIHPKGRGTYNA